MAPSPRISILENWAMRARRDLHTRTFSRLARLDSFLPVSVFKFPWPTPWAVVMPFVQQPDARQVYPAYERAMLREVERILKAIPHHDLAIQWDVCLEMLAWDGRWPTSPPFPGMEQVFAANFQRLAAAVPSGVELGFQYKQG